MYRRFAPIALICALMFAAVGPLAGSAAGAGLSAPVLDCNDHGQLTKHYTAQQLRSALATMPADLKQYTNCYDLINHALLAQLGKLGGTGSGSGGGSFLPTWLLVVLGVLVVGGAGFGGLALRQRGGR
jgi:hypothetical protein